MADGAYFNDQSPAAILGRMLANPAMARYGTIAGNRFYTLLSVVSGEQGNQNFIAQQLRLAQQILWAVGDDLTQWGATFGVRRLGPRTAGGAALLAAPPGTVIAAGTIVGTATSSFGPALTFTTDADATIPGGGSLAVAITASAPGSAYDLPAHSISQVYTLGTGITGIDNPLPTGASPFTVGAEAEPDGRPGVRENYRGRILQTLSTDQWVGSYDWYVAQAQGLGAGVVKVEFLWNGPGTVRLTILDPDGNIPSPTLAQAIQDALDPAPQGTGQGRLGPLAGTVVTVIPATARALTLVVPGLVPQLGVLPATAKANLEAAVQTYWNVLGLTSGTVEFSRTMAIAITAPGVETVDALGLRLNGGTADVVLGPTEAPILAQPVSYPA